jgi:hypothetical protein
VTDGKPFVLRVRGNRENCLLEKKHRRLSSALETYESSCLVKHDSVHLACNFQSRAALHKDPTSRTDPSSYHDGGGGSQAESARTRNDQACNRKLQTERNAIFSQIIIPSRRYNVGGTQGIPGHKSTRKLLEGTMKKALQSVTKRTTRDKLTTI